MMEFIEKLYNVGILLIQESQQANKPAFLLLRNKIFLATVLYNVSVLIYKVLQRAEVTNN